MVVSWVLFLLPSSLASSSSSKPFQEDAGATPTGLHLGSCRNASMHAGSSGLNGIKLVSFIGEDPELTAHLISPAAGALVPQIVPGS